ncbi:MAG: hypothetical protein AABX55_01035, partial [Nanoarchaeota archaeon]
MIKQISNYEIEESRKILDDHVVPEVTQESALESLLFCISGQVSLWESSVKFIRNLRLRSHPYEQDAIHKVSSFDVLTNRDYVNQAAREGGLRFSKHSRFDSSIEYFLSEDHVWWKYITDADVKLREEYVKKIKWLGEKTFSLWHLCLGGKNLLALDVWVMKGLSKLGIELNPRYIIPQKRTPNSRAKVREAPNRKEYLRIEQEAYNLFLQDSRFLLPNGKVDVALV